MNNAKRLRRKENRKKKKKEFETFQFENFLYIYSNMRNANKMADSLQLDGSKLKLTTKTPNSIISTETLQSAQISANGIHIDANQLKNSQCDKSENCVPIDASANDAIIDSISSALTLSRTNGIATKSIYQPNRQKKLNQIFTKQELQSQQMNIQKITKSAKQEHSSLMDLQEIEDSRKKRCSDRYDSSESSDSGVATLSITDSSATSSEDASNFDSPYNNTSMNNNDSVSLHLNNVKRSKHSLQVPKNSSNHSKNNNKNKQDTRSSAPPSALWPWNVPTDATSQAASTRNITLANAQNSNTLQTLSVKPLISNDKSAKTTSSCNPKTKRNSSSEAHSSSSSIKRNRLVQSNAFSGIASNPSSTITLISTTTPTATTVATSSLVTQSTSNNSSFNVRSQTKITGYFKSQVKALPNLKKDLTNMVVRSNELAAETASNIETAATATTKTQCTDVSHQSSNGASDKKTDTLPLVQNSNNNLSVYISPLNGTAQVKVERKTAKVSPIARKSNVIKKPPYANVLPKKHVNIAPRTHANPLNVSSMALPTMADAFKAHQTKSMLQSNRQRVQVKLFRRQNEIGTQNEFTNQANDFGVVPTLLTTIRLPTNGNTMTAATASSQKQPTLTTVQPNHSTQAHKNMQHAQQKPTKINGSIYQLQTASVIQFPVATKETNTQATNNIVVNNGYFINGAIIKLQQMLSQQQTTPSLTNESQIGLPQKANFTQKFNCQQTNPKIAPASNLIHDSQSLASHNDLSQRFVTNGQTNSQYAQPTVFIPTSSGLLLTTALPAMLTSQLSNMQPLTQQQQMPPLHQFNQQSHAENNKSIGDKSSIALSVDKRQLRPCIIPSPALTVTLAENNLQSNYLTNNSFPYNVLSTTSSGIQPNCNQNQMNSIEKNANTSSRLYSGGNLTMPSTNLTYAPRTITAMLSDTSNKKSVDATKMMDDVTARSLPITFSVSSPPPLCVQSTKELIPFNNEYMDFHSIKVNPTPSITYAQSTLNAEKNMWSRDFNNDISRTKTENGSITKLTNNLNNNISMNERNDLSGQPHNKMQPALVQIQNIKHDECNRSTDHHTIQVNLESSDNAATMGHSKNTTTTIDTNVAVAMLPACSKSPILSQPKTIRFPANGSRHRDNRTAGCCFWDDCNENCETSSNLLDHLQTKHVNSQQAPFSCRWANCKVHGRESCSRKWLERHVLSHGGSKLFKCIFEKCRMRFGSQLALQKHVNGHINSTENKDSTVRRSSDPPVPKKLRMNGKRLRYRRQPFSARMFDYFDNGVMEELQHRLLKTVNLTSCLNGTITFKGRSIGRRVTATGSVELLVKWNPCDIISDEWISANKPSFTKTIQLTSLSQSERVSLMDHLNYSYKFPTNCSSSSSTSSSMSENSTKITDKS